MRIKKHPLLDAFLFACLLKVLKVLVQLDFDTNFQ